MWFSLRFRGRSVEQLCFSWRKAIDDPGYESSLGHDPSPWEGYSWLLDSRFVDEVFQFVNGHHGLRWARTLCLIYCPDRHRH